MSDLAIDQETLDLYVGDLDLQVTTGIDNVIQAISNRLRFFRGEWFLDTSSGTPYFTDIFTKNPNIPRIENIYIAQILETPGVNELLEFDLQLNNNRSVELSFKVNTIYGPAEFEKTIFVTV